ncbi:YqgE/AlgH family protein [Acidithiobacillus sulfuriphilus]|uniref:YqgE/AlgH family protein n=1 Tax=Acidithiobacillus sulfuriphilus TaxID=1867749 RepID=UPI003F6352DC
MSFQSLKNHLLIAMPGLHDGLFDRTVIVICEHTEEGAMGIVINRLLDLNLADALRAVDIVPGEEMINQGVYWGGPVQEQNGFILHTPAGAWQSSLAVSSDLVLTTSPDLLTAIAQHEGPDRFLLALGYAGWGGGQLEAEIKDNAWLHGPADPVVIFDLAAGERWQAAARLIGVDMRLLSGAAGHA